jgi:hypothetical protein
LLVFLYDTQRGPVQLKVCLWKAEVEARTVKFPVDISPGFVLIMSNVFTSEHFKVITGE